MTTKRTAPQVRKILRQIGDELPDRTNPREVTEDEGSSCVYTSPVNLNQHCIAGEVCARLNVPLPAVDSPENHQALMHTGIRQHFTGPALVILRAAQRRADLRYSRWSAAVEYALSGDVGP